MSRRPLSLKAKALALLARREYSRQELERKLMQVRKRDGRINEGFADASGGDADVSPTPDDAGPDDAGFQSGNAFRTQAPVGEGPPPPDPDEDLHDLLDDFERRGWLSEARFVEASVHRLSRRYGPRRIEQTLRERGASDASIEAARPYLRSQAEATARAALKRRFPVPPGDAAQRARQVRFLQARGFDYDVIRKVLDASPDPEVD